MNPIHSNQEFLKHINKNKRKTRLKKVLDCEPKTLIKQYFQFFISFPFPLYFLSNSFSICFPFPFLFLLFSFFLSFFYSFGFPFTFPFLSLPLFFLSFSFNLSFSFHFTLLSFYYVLNFWRTMFLQPFQILEKYWWLSIKFTFIYNLDEIHVKFKNDVFWYDFVSKDI